MRKIIACVQPSYQTKMQENASWWTEIIKNELPKVQAELLEKIGPQTRLLLQLAGPNDCFPFFDSAITQLLENLLKNQPDSACHPDGKFRLVSVGAGLSLESTALRDFFTTSNGKPEITNIDNDPIYDLANIKQGLGIFFDGTELERVYNAIKDRRENYKIKDGSRPAGYDKKCYDVGFLFHPYSKISEEIIDELLAHIKHKGRIVVTTYYPEEVLKVQEQLERYGCKTGDIQVNPSGIKQYLRLYNEKESVKYFSGRIPQTSYLYTLVAEKVVENHVSKQPQHDIAGIPSIYWGVLFLLLYILRNIQHSYKPDNDP